VRGPLPWIVEFYAPWCTHCQTSTHAFRQVATRLDGEFEFGAVNGQNNIDLRNRFTITEYPSFFVFSPRYDVSAKYHWRGSEELVQRMPDWAREMAQEWDRLFSRTNVIRLNEENFDTELKESKEAWLVMAVGTNCPQCADTKPNWYRFSTDMLGLASVGLIDCSTCPSLCQREGIHFAGVPSFVAYPRGDKTKHPEQLFTQSDLASHHALPLIAKVCLVN
jgi:protein disulfide-isomerase A6